MSMASPKMERKPRKNKAENEVKVKFTLAEAKRQSFLITVSAIFLVYGFIFYYVPLGGWVMAFQNYKPKTAKLVIKR